MFLIGWFATVAQANELCNPDEHFQFALSALISGDYEASEVALKRAREAYGCGQIANRQSLARYWLVDGALALAQGDSTSANDSLAAARTLAPDLWLPNLPQAVRTAWENTESPSGRGALVIDPPVGGRPLWIDGASVVGPAEVAAGSHLVQIGDQEGSVVFADTVWVGSTLTVRVETGLAAQEPEAALDKAQLDSVNDVASPEEPRKGPRVVGHLLGGFGAAFGTEVTLSEVVEPATKLTIPGELGLGLQFGVVTTRLQIGTAFLTQGAYLGRSNLDEDVITQIRQDFGLGVVAGKRFYGGGVLGIQWPGRLIARGVFGMIPIGPLMIELRGGGNLVADRGFEPALELMAGVQLR